MMRESGVPLERSSQATCGDLRALGSRGRCLGTEKMRSAMQLPSGEKWLGGRGLSGPGHRPEEVGQECRLVGSTVSSEDKIRKGAIFYTSLGNTTCSPSGRQNFPVML